MLVMEEISALECGALHTVLRRWCSIVPNEFRRLFGASLFDRPFPLIAVVGFYIGYAHLVS